jgi:hypothetical protein
MVSKQKRKDDFFHLSAFVIPHLTGTGHPQFLNDSYSFLRYHTLSENRIGEYIMKKSIFLFLLTVILVSGCSGTPTRRARSTATETPATQPPASTSTPKPVSSPTEEPTITPTVTATLSKVTLAQDTICRLGPNENYYKLYPYFKGDAFILNGRNEDNTWVLVKENQADDLSLSCWVPVSALKNPGKLDGLSIAKYEALPIGPSSITAPNGVCGANRPMIVEWSPLVDGVEYRLYRNWKAVSTQTEGKYYDMDLPDKGKAVVFTYMVQAINDYGTSPSIAVSVTYCGK